jgi:hypothetical protein
MVDQPSGPRANLRSLHCRCKDMENVAKQPESGLLRSYIQRTTEALPAG